ncbi:hypothetical protein ATI61_102372 [Archangium gephyra]|uniref:Uncharacterized protein n=1 Tax=Archangium gephyra TaxID=48 RepID=A0AAC8TGZ9_9BACT|nr:hypothetical protein [Archangium gephyra]AKJ05310.1 Hypothetical protein AA314_06936 [Archangium gephyra]REG35998.1 hypothetical protein ATI61_102372 [Archangium gephyra]
MTTFQSNPGNGGPSSNGSQAQGNEGQAGFGHKVDRIGSDAQQLWDDARGAVTDLQDTLDLKGRVDRNPYLMMAAALGVGYVLGGGLFTRTTGRLLRLGVRLAALPMVKDELIGMAEAALHGVETGARMAGTGNAGGASDRPQGSQV